ncbi:hypothetical protein EVAR_7487_1 [Eumeta japonica]|uniref:Uncharacterized protein n=1 Tax=Eumeta variegata TaxID=151549 RepID=A0A4C1Y3X7_EUMVA|nr:hypothetical protein EVAR_7487_1 [Eumeta japonica]
MNSFLTPRQRRESCNYRVKRPCRLLLITRPPNARERHPGAFIKKISGRRSTGAPAAYRRIAGSTALIFNFTLFAFVCFDYRRDLVRGSFSDLHYLRMIRSATRGESKESRRLGVSQIVKRKLKPIATRTRVVPSAPGRQLGIVVYSYNPI